MSDGQGILCLHCGGETRVLRTEPEDGSIERTRLCRSCYATIETRQVLHSAEPDTADLSRPHSRGFPCPHCGGSSRTLQTRNHVGQIRRRHHCTESKCGAEFLTREFPQRPHAADPHAGGG